MVSKTKELFFIWVIIFLSIFLRCYKADSYPMHNNDDGLVHTWLGISLLKNILKPTSSTIFLQNKNLFWFSQYNNTDNIRRFGFRLVQPYFDNPPLAMLFIGLPAKIFGFNDFIQIPQLIVRLPSLLISPITLYLTYILAKKIFDIKIALKALIIYGLSPYYIFSQRQSYIENFLTPFYLLTLVIFLKYLKQPKKHLLIFLIFLCIISGWIKIIGLSITFIICYWLLKYKKFKAAGLIFISGLLSIVTYFIYGILIDKGQFINTIYNQANRGIYASNFVTMITRMEFYEPFYDGICLFGFLACIFLVFTSYLNRKYDFFFLNFIFILLPIIMISGINNNFPWYKYPLFPFFCIATGYYLEKIYRYPTIFSILPLFLFGFTGLDLMIINIDSNTLRIIYLFFLLPFILKTLIKSNLLNYFCHKIIIILCLLILIINILVPLMYLKNRCLDDDCLVPDKIIVKQQAN